MTTRLASKIGPRRSTALAVSMVAVALAPMAVDVVLAHGSMHTPPSRVYTCRFSDNPENPQIPACAAAVAHAGGSQFLYDWNAIRQGDAAGQHQLVVPDGQLCSGGGAEYSGLDLPRDDWRATPLESDASGNFEFIYLATAPHSTEDMLFFVTPEGWDPTEPLTWGDLDFIDEPGNPADPVDPFCRLTSATLESLDGVGDVYRMTCPLPQRTGRHLIYHVWQRDDSPEAFYACIDVLMFGDGRIFGDGFESGDLLRWSTPSP